MAILLAAADAFPYRQHCLAVYLHVTLLQHHLLLLAKQALTTHMTLTCHLLMLWHHHSATHLLLWH
jgi:hypothetical protein